MLEDTTLIEEVCTWVACLWSKEPLLYSGHPDNEAHSGSLYRRLRNILLWTVMESQHHFGAFNLTRVAHSCCASGQQSVSYLSSTMLLLSILSIVMDCLLMYMYTGKYCQFKLHFPAHRSDQMIAFVINNQMIAILSLTIKSSPLSLSTSL